MSRGSTFANGLKEALHLQHQPLGPDLEPHPLLNRSIVPRQCLLTRFRPETSPSLANRPWDGTIPRLSRLHTGGTCHRWSSPSF